MRILILEDNVDRRTAMSDCLQDRFPQFSVEYFEASEEMVARMKQGIEDVALISLDHDLELIPTEPGALRDPGTGVDVTNWLAMQPPVCPVIVHTTNLPAGSQMEADLTNSGWRVQRIIPYSGEDWIFEAWMRLARDLVVAEIPVPAECTLRKTSFA